MEKNIKFEKGVDLMKAKNFEDRFNSYVDSINKQPDLIDKAIIYADLVDGLMSWAGNVTYLFTESIIEDPEDSMAFFYRGLGHLIGVHDYLPIGDNSSSRAMADLNTAIILDPKNPLPYYAMSKAWCYRDDYAEALEDAKTALALSSGVSSTIDFKAHVEFLTQKMKDYRIFKFDVGKHGEYSKAKYEGKTTEPVQKDWKHIDRSHRFKIRQGAVLREYVSPYVAPDKIFCKEFIVSKPPHSYVVPSRVRGLTVEYMEFEDGTRSQTQHLFEHEIWIRADKLKHPTGWYLPRRDDDEDDE